MFLYVNKTARVYKEMVRFQLQNLRISHQQGNEVEMELQPGEEYMIELKMVSSSQATKYSMQMSYALV